MALAILIGMTNGADPKSVTRYSPAANLISLALSALALPLALAPACYVLALTASRAILPWYFWYERYYVDAEFLLHKGFLIPLPFCFLTVFFTIRYLLGRVAPSWRKLEARPAIPVALWAKQILIALVMIPTGIAFFAFFGLSVAAFGNPFPTPTTLMQKDRCSKCHSPYRPFHFVKSADQWSVTVNRMRNVNGAKLSDEDVAKLAAYVASKASISDQWLFRAKCLRCHGKNLIKAKPRTAEEWTLIVDRVARNSPYAFRTDWREQLKNHLAKHYAASFPAEATQAKARQAKLNFERSCGACHALALSQKPQTDALALVEQMRLKAPDVFPQDESARLAEYMDTLPDEEAAFNELFPHDKLVEIAW